MYTLHTFVQGESLRVELQQEEKDTINSISWSNNVCVRTFSLKHAEFWGVSMACPGEPLRIKKTLLWK